MDLATCVGHTDNMSKADKDVNEQTGPAADSAQTDEAVDPREQMRIALEKKNQKSHQGQAHLDGHAKADGTHGKAGGPREFRRKSG